MQTPERAKHQPTDNSSDTSPNENSTNRWKNRTDPSDTASRMESKADDLGTKGKEIASGIVNKAQEYGEAAVERTSSFIQRYPGQTLLAGLGVGFILGMTLARR